MRVQLRIGNTPTAIPRQNTETEAAGFSACAKKQTHILRHPDTARRTRESLIIFLELFPSSALALFFAEGEFLIDVGVVIFQRL